MTEIEIIEKIKTHVLGKKDEAFEIYYSFCDCLKEKYGLVDRDYDDKPTLRGKEWIDIHHILEFELDDIARRTAAAKSCSDPTYTLEYLKPYNVKEKLVYANKIEHFLLHYLIDSIRGQDVLSGGPNYLWIDAVAIDLYGFDMDYLNNIKKEKEKYYSLMSSEEVTLVYKKMIDWKHWDIKDCARFWIADINIRLKMKYENVTYIEDKDKYFKLMDILGYKIDEETKDKILSLPYMYRILEGNDGAKIKAKGDIYYSFDLKTMIMLRSFNRKSFTVPSIVERIANDVFRFNPYLEMVTIPATIKEIEDKVFTERKISGERCCPKLKKIKYMGTSQMWQERFSNVDLNGIKLVCEKFPQTT